MGLIGDLLGGKKAPAPPAELAKSAGAVFDLAEMQKTRLPAARASTDAFLAALPDLLQVEGRWLDEAATRAGGMGDFYDDLFYGAGGDVLRRSVQDALVAGSEARQQEQELLAREAVMDGINTARTAQLDDQHRRGLRGGMVEAPSLAALVGAQAGAAGNAARVAERRYGEEIRRAVAPQVAGYGNAAVAGTEAAARLAEARTGSAAKLPMFTHSLLGGESSLASAAGGMYSNASDLFSTQYNAQLAKSALDNKRRANIFGNVVRLGAAIATGGASEIGGAGGMGSSFTPPTTMASIGL